MFASFLLGKKEGVHNVYENLIKSKSNFYNFKFDRNTFNSFNSNLNGMYRKYFYNSYSTIVSKNLQRKPKITQKNPSPTPRGHNSGNQEITGRKVLTSEQNMEVFQSILLSDFANRKSKKSNKKTDKNLDRAELKSYSNSTSGKSLPIENSASNLKMVMGIPEAMWITLRDKKIGAIELALTEGFLNNGNVPSTNNDKLSGETMEGNGSVDEISSKTKVQIQEKKVSKEVPRLIEKEVRGTKNKIGMARGDSLKSLGKDNNPELISQSELSTQEDSIKSQSNSIKSQSNPIKSQPNSIKSQSNSKISIGSKSRSSQIKDAMAEAESIKPNSSESKLQLNEENSGGSKSQLDKSIFLNSRSPLIQSVPIESNVKSTKSAPIESNVKSTKSVPIESNVKSTKSVPIESNVKSTKSVPIESDMGTKLERNETFEKESISIPGQFDSPVQLAIQNIISSSPISKLKKKNRKRIIPRQLALPVAGRRRRPQNNYESNWNNYRMDLFRVINEYDSYRNPYNYFLSSEDLHFWSRSFEWTPRYDLCYYNISKQLLAQGFPISPNFDCEKPCVLQRQIVNVALSHQDLVVQCYPDSEKIILISTLALVDPGMSLVVCQSESWIEETVSRLNKIQIRAIYLTKNEIKLPGPSPVAEKKKNKKVLCDEIHSIYSIDKISKILPGIYAGNYKLIFVKPEGLTSQRLIGILEELQRVGSLQRFVVEDISEIFKFVPKIADLTKTSKPSQIHSNSSGNSQEISPIHDTSVIKDYLNSFINNKNEELKYEILPQVETYGPLRSLFKLFPRVPVLSFTYPCRASILHSIFQFLDLLEPYLIDNFPSYLENIAITEKDSDDSHINQIDFNLNSLHLKNDYNANKDRCIILCNDSESVDKFYTNFKNHGITCTIYSDLLKMGNPDFNIFFYNNLPPNFNLFAKYQNILTPQKVHIFFSEKDVKFYKAIIKLQKAANKFVLRLRDKHQMDDPNVDSNIIKEFLHSHDFSETEGFLIHGQRFMPDPILLNEALNYLIRNIDSKVLYSDLEHLNLNLTLNTEEITEMYEYCKQSNKFPKNVKNYFYDFDNIKDLPDNFFENIIEPPSHSVKSKTKLLKKPESKSYTTSEKLIKPEKSCYTTTTTTTESPGTVAAAASSSSISSSSSKSCEERDGEIEKSIEHLIRELSLGVNSDVSSSKLLDLQDVIDRYMMNLNLNKMSVEFHDNRERLRKG